MAKANIYWDKSILAYRLKADFKPELIDFLKKNIPVSDRRYDPQTKIWTFLEKYLDGTVKLLGLIYGPQNVVVLTRAQVENFASQQSNTTTVKQLDTYDSILSEFMRLIPFEAAKKAYLNACMTMHPDKGGDPNKMSRINTLWTQISKEVYKQS